MVTSVDILANNTIQKRKKASFYSQSRKQSHSTAFGEKNAFLTELLSENQNGYTVEHKHRSNVGRSDSFYKHCALDEELLIRNISSAALLHQLATIWHGVDERFKV